MGKGLLWGVVLEIFMIEGSQNHFYFDCEGQKIVWPFISFLQNFGKFVCNIYKFVATIENFYGGTVDIG